MENTVSRNYDITSDELNVKPNKKEISSATFLPFNELIAEKFGVNPAIVYARIVAWVEWNKQNNLAFREGCHWTYQTIDQLHSYLPYLSKEIIKFSLQRLIEEKLIIRKYLSKGKYANVPWYTIGKTHLEVPKKDEKPRALRPRKTQKKETQVVENKKDKKPKKPKNEVGSVENPLTPKKVEWKFHCIEYKKDIYKEEEIYKYIRPAENSISQPDKIVPSIPLADASDTKEKIPTKKYAKIIYDELLDIEDPLTDQRVIRINQKDWDKLLQKYDEQFIIETGQLLSLEFNEKPRKNIYAAFLVFLKNRHAKFNLIKLKEEQLRKERQQRQELQDKQYQERMGKYETKNKNSWAFRDAANTGKPLDEKDYVLFIPEDDEVAAC